MSGVSELAENTEIRSLIERWAKAAQRLDMDGVMADHTPDMLMFDVPPPNEVRGIDAYRETWPPFFDSLRESGVFEIIDLNVTAGDRIAFATAPLRCGKEHELAEKPDVRLRLTVGLRKEGGRWMIAHEHHSFPLDISTIT